MPVRRSYLITLDLSVVDDSLEPAYLQIYRQLRAMIVDGRLPQGARLFSSRSYADRLKRSRNTIAAAYEMLLSEGLISSRRGSGTFVATNAADCTRSFPAAGSLPRELALTPVSLSVAGKQLSAGADWPIGGGQQFDPEGPDHRQFPFKEWGRLLRRVWQNPSPRVLFDFDPGGYRPLREQIALYLAGHRAVRCAADDILITAGSLHGLDLVSRLLLNPGDRVLFEDPGYVRGRSVFAATGVEVVSVPVDANGMCVGAGLKQAPDARLAYVTPSRQYPTGAVMSLERRRELVEWARRSEAWIFEDDYDSDFRLEGDPLQSIQGLEDRSRVIYAGSLSKVMFPGLRLGYLVLPEGMQPLFARARRALDLFPSAIAQAPLSLFLEEGYFRSHVNRMRRLYSDRRIVLIDRLNAHLGDLLDVETSQGGIEICTIFKSHFCGCLLDTEIAAHADMAGMRIQPLSIFYQDQPARKGLIFGLAILDASTLDRNLQRVRIIILSLLRNSELKAPL